MANDNGGVGCAGIGIGIGGAGVREKEAAPRQRPPTPDQLRERERLATSCMPLCRRLAAEACRGELAADYDDVLSAACWGLRKAVDHFDPSRGNRFTSLAYVAVKGAINDELAKLMRRKWRHCREERHWWSKMAVEKVAYDPAPEPGSDEDAGLLEEAVAVALEGLSEDVREVAFLMMQGCDRTEIARRTGRSRRQVGPRLERVREALKAAGLGPVGGDDE